MAAAVPRAEQAAAWLGVAVFQSGTTKPCEPNPSHSNLPILSQMSEQGGLPPTSFCPSSDAHQAVF